MTFEHKLFEPKKLEQITEADLKSGTGSSRRVYVTDKGNRYPSVTTALQYLSKRGIAKWRQRVGNEEANKVSARASRHGTAVHNIAEKYVRNDPLWNRAMPIPLASFMEIKPYLDNHLTEIYGIELGMYSDELCAAGTADLMCNYRGHNTILDFKTSAKPKPREWITGYVFQCAAYAIMAKELYNFNATQFAILMTVADGPAQEFVEPIEPWLPVIRKYFKYYHQGLLV